MDVIITLLLILVAVKFVVMGVVLILVFKPDFRQLLKQMFGQGEMAPQTTPSCIYCQSVWTRTADEGQTRWDEQGLVLVTTYECLHCHMPFWHVERVPVGMVKR